MKLNDSYHKIVHTHPFNQIETFFLSSPDNAIAESDIPVSLGELIDYTIEGGIHAHKW
jgi:hypothetical protein